MVTNRLNKVLELGDYWQNSANQRSLFDVIAKDLNISRNCEWSSISHSVLESYGAKQFIDSYHGGSLFNALESAYPTSEWNPYDFYPPSHWAHLTNQRNLLLRFEKQLGISSYGEWRQIAASGRWNVDGISHIVKSFYSNSIESALRSILPERKWDSVFEEAATEDLWKDLKDQRAFLCKLEREWGITDRNQWSTKTSKEVIDSGGTFVASLFGNSLWKALNAAFENFPLKESDFTRTQRPKRPKNEVQKNRSRTKGWWRDVRNQRAFLDEIRDREGVIEKSDWGKVTGEMVQNAGGSPLMKIYKGSLYQALQHLYPELGWTNSFSDDFPDRRQSQSKSQEKAWNILKPLIPDLLMNYLHPQMVHAKSNANMELDFWSPSLRLALEYQGRQHYEQSFPVKSLSEQRSRDVEKTSACQSLGITLVRIPYWWNGLAEELIATIHQVRPDVLHDLRNANAKPVPQVRPQKRTISQNTRGHLEAKIWNAEEVDPSNWWISDKISGVRALWTGKTFTSLGDKDEDLQKIVAPSAFRNLLPKVVALDGIFTLLKGTKEECKKVLGTDGAEWENVVFHVLDAPRLLQNFEARMQFLKSTIQLSKQLQLVKHRVCKDRKHLMNQLEISLKGGHEGLMIRKPGSFYENARSETLLSVELRESDLAVVQVQGSQIKGKNFFGFEFPLLHGKNVKSGQVVTYKFFSLSGTGIPQLARIEKIHDGFQWNQLSPYCLEVPPKIGHLPSCRGCGKSFDRGDLIVRLKVIKSTERFTKSAMMSLSFCADSECIISGTKKQENSQTLTIPKYQNRVGISPEIEYVVMSKTNENRERHRQALLKLKAQQVHVQKCPMIG
eukprot:TRINITY_DN611_c0_g1_i1.p1 TRINITY_DN611_c0_g1~~TRINITY_DN611_c0_g1_i1.p1  ORF type:complete len:842 (-),score=138.94 TRINITY_DN611_c0_g1_i1:636-3161(-)